MDTQEADLNIFRIFESLDKLIWFDEMDPLKGNHPDAHGFVLVDGVDHLRDFVRASTKILFVIDLWFWTLTQLTKLQDVLILKNTANFLQKDLLRCLHLFLTALSY